MREKEIEHHLVMETRRAGGMALKFVSPSFSGMPDRLVLLGDGKMGFVEVKAPGQKPRPLQLRRHAMLRRLGYQIFVLDAMEDIPAVLKAIAHTPDGKGGGGA
ncbi:VRR-NUC domain-containing protein [uncultured Megasphaera sp.]|uniref:VRR-NUC domain-containing protein n=2 Tax=Megasphaera TaxID=906 RepID=UPI00266F60EE|nr:VRR-NUC domain-containing protein [uncultured Megasphaera sp.]